MKPPPLMMGAALAFWGWQSGLPLAGLLLGAVLESARWIQARWDFTDDDFKRIWTFCSVLLLATAVYAFTSNEGRADLRGFVQHPNFFTGRSLGNATSRAAASWLRWSPATFFLLAAAQAFSSREGVPLETLSPILRLRWRRARKLGLPLPASRVVNVSHAYFAVCLFAASIHEGQGTTFFWGACALIAWALWPRRSPRFRAAIWLAALAIAIGVGYAGQAAVGQLQRSLENFNAQFLANLLRPRRFDSTRTKTALGQIGELKTSARIVIRLQPKQGPAPLLLREASYRSYRSQTWYSEITEPGFDRVEETVPNSGTWNLVPGRTNTSVVSVACYLEGGKALLPLPRDCARLEQLRAYLVQKSSLGAVLAEGPGLVVFDACADPGAGLDSPGGSNDQGIPPREAAAIDRVAAELHLAGQSPEQVLRTLRGYFQDGFTYSTWQEPPRFASTNETPLSHFLLESHRGHCEYFATATVLLLRRAGIPARYAVGFAVHERAGAKYVVRERDAHAWCLAWNQDGQNWEDFDTTPASWVGIEGKNAPVMQPLSDLWSWMWFQFSRVRWGQTHLRQYLLWGLVPVLGLLLYQIVFRRRRRRPGDRTSGALAGTFWPGLDSEFYGLEKTLASRVGRAPGERLSSWLLRAMASPGLAGLQPTVQSLLRLHYRYRFDPRGLDASEREELRREARKCRERVELA